MLPQGFSILNISHFNSVKKRVDGVGSCDDLQALINEVMATVQAEANAITAQMAALAPILALLSINPTDLKSVVKFLQGLITAILLPLVKPYLNYVIQVPAMGLQITALLAEFQAAIDRIKSLGIDCNVSIPAFSAPIIPNVTIPSILKRARAGDLGGLSDANAGVPAYEIPYPGNGQWQIPTDESEAAQLPALTAALHNWTDGVIWFRIPDDLREFDNLTHWGQLRITGEGGGGHGDLPSGNIIVDGHVVDEFDSETPDLSYSIDHPGSATFDTTRGSLVEMRLIGAGDWTLLMSTPDRYLGANVV